MRLKKTRYRRDIPLKSLGVLCLALFFLWKTLTSLAPTFWAFAETETRARTIAIMNGVITEYISMAPIAMQVERDSNQKVTLVRPDLAAINNLTAVCALRMQAEMKDREYAKAGIPLGLLTRNYVFAASGPKIGIHILPIGATKIDAVEEFESVGINQTRYVVKARVCTTARIITFLEWRDITIESDYPIAEIVFSGDVPSIMGLTR